MTSSAVPSPALDLEPVTVRPYIVAASALLRLAQPFFYAIEFGPDSPKNFQDDLARWRVLRGAARLLLERGAMQLTLAEACELREALRACPPGRDVDLIHDQQFDERA